MALINQRMIRVIAILGLVALLTALFVGGHQQGAGRLFPAPWDKLAHFTFYATLTALACIAFPKVRLPIIGVMIIAIGGADEIHQIFVPGRHPGLDDLIADISGCILALLIIVWLRKKNVTHQD